MHHRARDGRRQFHHLLRLQGAKAADHHLRPHAGRREEQGHRARRRVAQQHGHDPQRLRRRGPRPAPGALLDRKNLRLGQAGRQVPAALRGSARSDRPNRRRAGASQDHADDRHRLARSPVRGQSRIFPHARRLHRGRRGNAETRRRGHDPRPAQGGGEHRRRAEGAGTPRSAFRHGTTSSVASTTSSSPARWRCRACRASVWSRRTTRAS